MKSRLIAALSLGGMVPGPALLDAQEDPDMPTPVTLPSTEVFDLYSEHAQADYQLWVASPVQGIMPMPPGPRHVLYVLDANLFFGTAVEMTRLMAQLYGELPPLLVVGIAYDTAVPAVQAELRARDFTPTADAGFEAMARRLPGATEPTLPEGRRLGRGPEFLSFLSSEVRPFIEERYAPLQRAAPCSSARPSAGCSPSTPCSRSRRPSTPTSP